MTKIKEMIRIAIQEVGSKNQANYER